MYHMLVFIVIIISLLKKIVKNVKKLQYKVVYILIETGPNNYNILITFLIINYMIL